MSQSNGQRHSGSQWSHPQLSRSKLSLRLMYSHRRGNIEQASRARTACPARSKKLSHGPAVLQPPRHFNSGLPQEPCSHSYIAQQSSKAQSWARPLMIICVGSRWCARYSRRSKDGLAGCLQMWCRGSALTAVLVDIVELQPRLDDIDRLQAQCLHDSSSRACTP